MGILGIDFTPLHEPLEKQLQTLAVAFWIFLIVFAIPIFYVVTVLILLFTSVLRWFMIAYLVWVYFYDFDSCDRGGRHNWTTRWMRNSAWWRNYCHYFPIKIVKTAELDPSRNYLFCASPHGFMCLGITGAFSTDILDFNKLFPGLRSTVLTIGFNFYHPLSREIPYSMGLASASKRCIETIISTPGGGRVAFLIPGGVEEALRTKLGEYTTILRRRMGFVKIALQHGTPLVPVIVFGETDLYDQLDGPSSSYMRRIQMYCRKTFGFAPVIPRGRGLFQNTFGLVPRRMPITVVVGAPVELPVIAEPTEKDVIEYRRKYAESLLDLFETHKRKYVKDPESTNLIID